VSPTGKSSSTLGKLKSSRKSTASYGLKVGSYSGMYKEWARQAIREIADAN